MENIVIFLINLFVVIFIALTLVSAVLAVLGLSKGGSSSLDFKKILISPSVRFYEGLIPDETYSLLVKTNRYRWLSFYILILLAVVIFLINITEQDVKNIISLFSNLLS